MCQQPGSRLSGMPVRSWRAHVVGVCDRTAKRRQWISAMRGGHGIPGGQAEHTARRWRLMAELPEWGE